MPLQLLIAGAYEVKAARIFGGPKWIGSGGYDIIAKAELSPEEAEARKDPGRRMAEVNLRLQTLREERFNLKVHRETRDLPVCALTISKAGLKLLPSNCKVIDPAQPPPPPAPGDPLPAFCGFAPVLRNGAGWKLPGTGITMTDLIRQISNASGLSIIDKTGYEAFNATLEWTPGELAPSLPGPGNGGNPVSLAYAAGPSLFVALQEQLGLKLESTKGPVEVLVIDHVERPSAN